eukprot:TRINITY_DN12159_c0_g1_i3.p1 TRINITY_DN12159_c0_g1~~TRINITY_DN12159_c0_g1_i3.p1  ORF type:complete len:558 (+),score=130.89 TRINITY_DN12159_c0_g1_i3:186-1859(+)
MQALQLLRQPLAAAARSARSKQTAYRTLFQRLSLLTKRAKTHVPSWPAFTGPAQTLPTARYAPTFIASCVGLRFLLPVAQCSAATLEPERKSLHSRVVTLTDHLSALKDENAVWRALRVARRILRHFVLFAPPLVVLPIAWLLKTPLPFLWDGWWRWFLWTVQISGPTFIKFGQWASARRDLFSEEVCQRCSHLHDSVMHHSVTNTESTLDASFGPTWRDILELEEVPVGSGCVAQVYRAVLRRPGQEPRQVAVKVIHPLVQKQVADDVDLLRYVAWFVELIPMLRWVSAGDGVEEFAYSMLQQLDLRNETQNMLRFQENFKDIKDVIVPEVEPDLTSENVLVESYEHGQPMHVMFNGDNKLRKKLARRGLELFFKMMFKDNFIHGDLHPGNMRVTGIDSKGHLTGEPVKILLLDGGIVTEMTKRDRINFIDLFGAIVQKDGRECGHLMLSRARLHDCSDPEGFINAIDKLVKEACDTGMKLNKVRVGELLQRVLGLMCTYRVKIESNFTNVLIGIMVAEGVGRALDPEVDLMVLAGPILLKEKAKLALTGEFWTRH